MLKSYSPEPWSALTSAGTERELVILVKESGRPFRGSGAAAACRLGGGGPGEASGAAFQIRVKFAEFPGLVRRLWRSSTQPGRWSSRRRDAECTFERPKSLSGTDSRRV